MNALKTTLAIIAVVLIIVFLSSFYTVNQSQEALLLRFGELQKNTLGTVDVKQPGLHFKIPFLEQDVQFDTRLQTLDITSSRIVTSAKEYLVVDYYVKWRINNLPLFYVSTGGDYQQAGTLLQQQLDDILRAQFGQRTMQEIVTQDRVKLMSAVLAQVNKVATKLGIDIVDVRIKQVELPESGINTVYQQMTAKREEVATARRSQGLAMATSIRTAADDKVIVILANAKMQAAEIRAEGEATAAKIYAAAYNQDPDFYAFYRSMEAYQNTFTSKRDILVLRPDSEFFKYFNNFQAQADQNKK